MTPAWAELVPEHFVTWKACTVSQKDMLCYDTSSRAADDEMMSSHEGFGGWGGDPTKHQSCGVAKGIQSDGCPVHLVTPRLFFEP